MVFLSSGFKKLLLPLAVLWFCVTFVCHVIDARVLCKCGGGVTFYGCVVLNSYNG